MSEGLRENLASEFYNCLLENNFEDCDKIVIAYEKYKNAYLKLASKFPEEDYKFTKE